MKENEKISRQEAIKKMGKYAAFAALGTMVILNPAKAQTCSVNSFQGSKSKGFGVKRTRKGMFNN